jgi:hypothetical protein
MSIHQRNTNLMIHPKPGQSPEQAIAETALQPSMLGSAVIDAYKSNFPGDGLKIMQTQEILAKSIEQLQSGDFSKVDAMLLSQASVLEMMFTSLARKATGYESLWVIKPL